MEGSSGIGATVKAGAGLLQFKPYNSWATKEKIATKFKSCNSPDKLAALRIVR